MAADERGASIYFSDNGGNSFYDTASDLNPALNETNMRAIGSQYQIFTDGNLIKIVQTDKTTFYPTVEGGE